jgi:replicative DNA helicase
MANLKVPPHNKEAEESVLGSILIDKDAIIKIADFLETGDFYFEKNALVYDAMLTLYHKHYPIDLITLTNLLEDRKQLVTLGGTPFIAELTSAVPTSTHIFHYAQIVKNKAILRKMILAGDKIMGYAYAEDEELPVLLEKTDKEIFNITKNFIKDKFVHIKEILGKRFEVFAELHMAEDKDAIKGVPTGFYSLDSKLSGLQPADLIILAARPSMGKTALSLSIALNAALKYNKYVGVFSLEMSKEQLVDRMFSSQLKVDSWKLQKGKLDDTEFQNMGIVMDELSRAPIFIDDSVGASIGELRAKARRQQMEHGLDLIIIDYLQLMTTGNANFQTNRVNEISEISRSLKALGRELKVPILALSQLSRAVELRPGKVPQLSDLRESGAIEQDADVVLMMYREDYYDVDTDRKGITDVFIRKHRNGPVGKVELMFSMEQMRFYDIEKRREVEMMV